MEMLRPSGRRGRSLAALALTLALGIAACGRGKVPAAEYDPDAPPPQDTSAPAAAEAAPAPPPAPGAPPPAPLTPEQDSIQEARAFALRQRSMETYESCMQKANVVQEEPVRTILREACARNRRARP